MMATVLSDVGRELYDQLTARTLYVVDTEFATNEGEHHLISIGIVPVIGGRRTFAGQELYREMHPGVPIDDISRGVHGFTDESVAGKNMFPYYARVIAERLADPDAVFVCYSTIDAHVLRREFERLDEARTGSIGLADIPDLTVLDAQKLAHAVGYPGVTGKTKISLDKVCTLAGVARPVKAHNARDDARATANAVIELLRHAAERAVFWTLDDLLEVTSGGTLHSPTGPAHIRAGPAPRTPLPPAHVAKHIWPMSDPVTAGSREAEQWLDRASE